MICLLATAYTARMGGWPCSPSTLTLRLRAGDRALFRTGANVEALALVLGFAVATGAIIPAEA